MKQAEREDAWAKVDAQAQEVFKDDASMKGFLNFMAQCTPQSTRNLLILYNQNKEITHPRTFDKWKEAGRSIRSGEKGYTFFADQEYTKEDGNIANGYTITKAYDISQTRGPQPLPPQKHLPEEIIAATRPMAGMWWAAAKSTPRLNATWNLQNKSGKITIMLQNLRKRSCKTETKELQYSYRKQ